MPEGPTDCPLELKHVPLAHIARWENLNPGLLRYCCQHKMYPQMKPIQMNDVWLPLSACCGRLPLYRFPLCERCDQYFCWDFAHPFFCVHVMMCWDCLEAVGPDKKCSHWPRRAPELRLKARSGYYSKYRSPLSVK